MRTVHFVKESGPYAAGMTVSIDDQEASSAIAAGLAVPDPGHVFGTPAALPETIAPIPEQIADVKQETAACLSLKRIVKE